MACPRHSGIELRTAQYESLEPEVIADGHVGFVNSLAVENVYTRYLLCGGADSSVTIWDLYELDNSDRKYLQKKLKPSATFKRKMGHTFGVSKVLWWPFDNGMFLTASFDGTVKLWDTAGLEEAYAFTMEHRVYNIDVSAGEDGTALVAVGMDHPSIRLLDLRSGSQAQTLQGHSDSVISVKWCPTRPHILASAGSDGTIRLWDIRQAKSMVTSLDMACLAGHSLTPLDFRKAHRGVVNGLCWSPLGDELISLGNDNKARVWDLTVPGGENAAINYGPLVQNRFPQNLDPILSPPGDLLSPYLFIPCDTGDILMTCAGNGRLVRRLRPKATDNGSRAACLTSRGPRWAQFFSGDGNGRITFWRPAKNVIDSDAGADETAPPRLGDYL